MNEARDLAHWLRDPSRVKPMIVITTSVGAEAAWFDPVVVAEGVGALADVLVLPTGPLTWGFQAELPPMTEVYGGASRVSSNTTT